MNSSSDTETEYTIRFGRLQGCFLGCLEVFCDRRVLLIQKKNIFLFLPYKLFGGYPVFFRKTI